MTYSKSQIKEKIAKWRARLEELEVLEARIDEFQSPLSLLEGGNLIGISLAFRDEKVILNDSGVLELLSIELVNILKSRIEQEKEAIQEGGG